MPKIKQEIDPSIDVEAEIEKARARMKSRKTLETETDKLAAVVKKERKQIDGMLRAAFKRETAETTLVGWTQMGLIEIQRQRDRLPLSESL